RARPLCARWFVWRVRSAAFPCGARGCGASALSCGRCAAMRLLLRRGFGWHGDFSPGRGGQGLRRRVRRGARRRIGRPGLLPGDKSPNPSLPWTVVRVRRRESSVRDSRCGIILQRKHKRKQEGGPRGQELHVNSHAAGRGPHNCTVQARTCTMTPAPPVIEEILARIKLPRTPVMVRASPAVAVEVSMGEYCASASTIAVCSATLTADGAVPKMVCHRTIRPFSGNPAKFANANCWLACPAPGASLLNASATSPGEIAYGGTCKL